MNKFEKQLEKWNGGVLRGAQAKLAKILKVSTATVALWTTGKRHPSKGYAQQMAALFGLDLYGVTRLFEDSSRVAYPLAAENTPRHCLRESETTYTARPVLSAQSNSAALPLLTQLPPDGAPLFEDSDVLEWWTLPRLRTRGAQFMLQLSPRLIAAVKPSTEWAPGQEQLIRTPLGLLAARVFRQDGQIWLDIEGQKRPADPLEQAKGVIVFKVLLGEY